MQMDDLPGSSLCCSPWVVLGVVCFCVAAAMLTCWTCLAVMDDSMRSVWRPYPWENSFILHLCHALQAALLVSIATGSQLSAPSTQHALNWLFNCLQPGKSRLVERTGWQHRAVILTSIKSFKEVRNSVEYWAWYELLLQSCVNNSINCCCINICYLELD